MEGGREEGGERGRERNRESVLEVRARAWEREVEGREGGSKRELEERGRSKYM